MINKKLFLILISGFICIPTWAANKVKALPTDIKDYVLSIPANVTDIKSLQQKQSITTPALEFFMSDWEPQKFSRDSYVPEERMLSTTHSAWLSLSRLDQVLQFNNGTPLYSVMGVCFAQMERRGLVPGFADQYFIAQQKLKLFSARLGLEYQGLKIFHPAINPYASFAVLPSLLSGAKSQLESRVTDFGIPLEMAFGVTIKPSLFLKESNFQSPRIGFGVHSILGKVGQSDISDTMAQVFLRLDLTQGG